MENNDNYLQDLIKERDMVDPCLTNVLHTVNKEIERLQSGEEINENGHHDDKSDKTCSHIEVAKPSPIKLKIKVSVPVKEHPTFNFVGKLLGPKGMSLKRLQEETGCKMAILGKGSVRDKAKEAELKASNDPKFTHLNEELHVLVTAYGLPSEVYGKVANAIEGVKKYLNPDHYDDIRSQQMEEMNMMNGSRGGGRGGGPPHGGPPRGGGGPMRGGPSPMGGSRGGRGGGQGGQSQWVSLGSTPPQRTSTPRGRGGRGGRGAPPRGRGGPGMPPSQGMPNQDYGFCDMDAGFGGDNQSYDDSYFQGPNTQNDRYYDYNQGTGDNFQGGNHGDYSSTSDYTDWNPESNNRMKPDQAGGPVRRGGSTRGSFRTQPYAGGQSYGGNRF